MSRFNFRLQKVLDLKERGAQSAAAQVAVAQIRADEAADARDAIAAIRQAGGAQMVAAHGSTTAGQLQNSSYLLEKIDRHMDLAGEVADAALGSLVLARRELVRAHQAKRALDRLRERRLGDWQVVNTQTDRQQMDAQALTQYTRRNSHLSDQT